MTAVIVALLTFPLAALRPFQQPTTDTLKTNARADEFPASFKVTFSDPSKLTISDPSAAPGSFPGWRLISRLNREVRDIVFVSGMMSASMMDAN